MNLLRHPPPPPPHLVGGIWLQAHLLACLRARKQHGCHGKPTVFCISCLPLMSRLLALISLIRSSGGVPACVSKRLSHEWEHLSSPAYCTDVHTCNGQLLHAVRPLRLTCHGSATHVMHLCSWSSWHKLSHDRKRRRYTDPFMDPCRG
eukprot:1699836-Amphidinium_carterae.1